MAPLKISAVKRPISAIMCTLVGLKYKDKRSRDLVTVGPIFIFFFFKMRKTRKKKVSERRTVGQGGTKVRQNSCLGISFL